MANVTSLVTTASISAGALLQGTNSSVGVAVAAATRAPHFNSLGNGLVSVSDSIFYQGGSGGLRVAAESTLMASDDMVGAAFRSQKAFTASSKALNTVGNAIAVGTVAFDVGSGIAENIENGASTERIVGDATGDLIVSGGTAAVSAGAATLASVLAAKGAVAGSVVPGIGNLVGALAGAVIGLVSYGVFDKKIYKNGKTGRENLQDWMTNALIWAEENAPVDALNAGGQYVLAPLS